MKSIGIKLADGSFYPVMEDGKSDSKTLQLTTVKDNQTTVKVDLYQSESGSMEDAEYLDTLQIENLNPHPNGEPDFNLSLTLDDDNNLSASVNDPETNISVAKEVPFIKRSAEERGDSSEIAQADDITDIDVNDFDEVKGDIELSPTSDNEISLEGNDGIVSDVDDASLPSLDDLDLSSIDEVTEDSDITEPSAPEADATEDLGDTSTNDFEMPEIEDVASETESEGAPEADATEDFGDTSTNDFEMPEIEDVASEPESEGAPEADTTEDLGDTSTNDFEMPEIEDVASETESEGAPEADATEDLGDTSTNDFEMPEIEDVASETESEGAPEADATEDLGDVSTNDFEMPEIEDVDLSEFGMENTDEPIVENAPVRDATEADTAIQEAEPKADSDDLDDISLDITTSIPVDEDDDFEIPQQPQADESESTETESENAETESSDDFGLPDIDDEPPAEESAEKTDNSNEDFDFTEKQEDDFKTDSDDEVKSDFDTSDIDNGFNSDFTSDDNTEPSIDMGSSDTSFDLPDDFGDSDSGAVDMSDVSGSDSGTVVSDSGLDLSDLDNDPAFNTGFEVPDFDDPKVKSESFSFDDDFNDPAFALPTETAGSNYSSSSYSSPSMTYDNGEKKRGGSAAAVICVICAIICLAATALALFVLPSRLNIQNLFHQEQSATTEPVTENTTAGEKTVPVAPKAQENVIVVSPIAEVVPEKQSALTEVTEDVGEDGEKKEVEGIRYQIRWGDTLWDIADTYYRNPWLYPRIAKYNNITDPDFIVSGTYITIPK